MMKGKQVRAQDAVGVQRRATAPSITGGLAKSVESSTPVKTSGMSRTKSTEANINPPMESVGKRRTASTPNTSQVDTAKQSSNSTVSLVSSSTTSAAPSVSTNKSVIAGPSTDMSVSSQSSTTTPSEQEKDNIEVCVRVRPLVKVEKESHEAPAWILENNTTITQNYLPAHLRNNENNSSLPQLSTNDVNMASYTFDYLFHPEHDNDYIFQSVVKKIVSKSMQGFHGSVFAYGQTSSGKTYSMNGTAKQPGVIPLTIFECFDRIRDYEEREFLFRVSYLEIYNESVHDLLNPELTQIKIQYDPKSNTTTLVGVKEQVVVNPQQVLALLQSGEAHRHVGSTDMNEKSSRAHTLFKLIIESKKRCDDGREPVRFSTLNLVDLAGSENAKMTNSKGERAKEAKYINQSLLTLSSIIHRLSEEKPNSTKKQHLPYRDSKLTRILQQSLSGNAHIAIICTISPTLRCAEESNNTLKFGSRAKLIKMDAKVNETMDDKTLLKAYRREIDELREKLALMENLVQAPQLRKSNSKKKAPTPRHVNPYSEHDDDDNVSASSSSSDSKSSDDEKEGSGQQALLLQMIDHMERLILKGEENAKRESLESSPPSNKKNATLAKSQALKRSSSLSVTPSYRSEAPLTNKKQIATSDNKFETIPESNSPSSKQIEPVDKATIVSAVPTDGNLSLQNGEETDNKNSANTESNRVVPQAKPQPRQSRLQPPKRTSQFLPPKDVPTVTLEVSNGSIDKAISSVSIDNSKEICDNGANGSQKMSNDRTTPVDTELVMSIITKSRDEEDELNEDNDDFFSSRNRLTSFSRKENSHSPEMLSMSNRRATLDIVSSPRYESAQLRTMSADANKSATTQSGENVSTSNDPVMNGIRQMLAFLKQQVGASPSVSGVAVRSHDAGGHDNVSKRDSTTRRSFSGNSLTAEVTHSTDREQELMQTIRLKESDNKFLQDQVDRLQSDLVMKDNLLNMLTDGLKEVELNHTALLNSEESLTIELDLTKQAYHEVVHENNILRDEVIRLMAVLDAREKQFFQLTGKNAEEEEF